MQEVKFTTEQKAVIDARDCNLLVSAAAGSGKTAVLVERIIGRLLDETHPASLDRLLVMTFTRAAAEGMKQKISEALSSRIRETEKLLKVLPEGSDEWKKAEELRITLKSQEALLPRARISTIDSICQNMIRQYFQYLEIDPAFRVADEAELKLMRTDLLKDLLEEEYEEAAEDFVRFSEAFTKNGLDEKLSDLILRTCDFAQAKPWPEEFIEGCEQDARLEAAGNVWETKWFELFMENMKKRISRMAAAARETEDLCSGEGGWKPYLETAKPLAERCALLEKALEKKDLKEAYLSAGEVLAGPDFPALSRKKCEDGDGAKKEAAKEALDVLRKQLKELAGSCFLMSEGELTTATAMSAKDLCVLCRLTLKFMERFEEKKRSKSVVDFGDMEHLALRLLYDGNGENRRFSPLADELALGLDEILIDEYQDSNEVQEELIRALSAERFGRPDVFMVGDVKQSIYSFRQAKPALFMEKYKTYTGSGKNVKIELNKNFRSRPEVLGTVNDIFKEIMKPSCGGILYDEEASLHTGRKDCLDETGNPVFVPEAKTELLLVEEKTGDEPGSGPYYFSEEEAEFVMIAERILELTDPAKTTPPWRKKDITILMRSTTKAELLVDVLEKFGIDACFDSATGYFASREVSTVLSFLAVIDNPRQDTALVTVLKSPMGAFTDEELAQIRATGPKRSDGSPSGFYEALRAADEDGKVAEFLEKLNEYRDLAGHLPVHELICRIYRDTGYYDYVSALPGGKRRRRNLDMLLEKAENYSATSYHGLFNFTRYIEQLKNYETDYGEAASLSGDDDVVRVTTIHKSKGLEYPVTILAGMSTRFNTADTRENLMLNEELGMACDYVDTEKRIRYPSLKAMLIRERVKEEQAGEELRVLYVAMTRAREKLILTGKINDFFKKKEDLSGKTGTLSEASSQLQFLLRSGVLGGDSIRFHIYEQEALLQTPPEETQREKKDLTDLLESAGVSEEELAFLRERIGAAYAHEAETKLKPKVSVSELKAKLITESEFEFVRDLEENRKTKGAEYGTIVHRAFELYDYGKDGEEALPDLPGVDEETMASVRRVMDGFLKTDLAREMEKAFREGRLYREKHFMIGLPASVLTPESGSEELQLLQGIIDAYILTPEGIRLIDYKTDRVEEEDKLVSRYALQLELYAKALEQLLRLPVTEKLIYSTCLGRVIRL